MIMIKSPGSKFPANPYEVEFKAELATVIVLSPDAASADKVVNTLTMSGVPESVRVPFFPFCPMAKPRERIRIADKISFVVFIACDKDAYHFVMVVPLLNDFSEN